jgi:hypothetical protein
MKRKGKMRFMGPRFPFYNTEPLETVRRQKVLSDKNEIKNRDLITRLFVKVIVATPLPPEGYQNDVAGSARGVHTCVLWLS